MQVDKSKIKVVEAGMPSYSGSAALPGYAGVPDCGLPDGYLKLGSCTEQGGTWSGKLMNALGAVHTYYPGMSISGKTENPFVLESGEPYAAICSQLNVPFHFSEILFTGKKAPPGQKAYDIFGQVSSIQMDFD